MAAKASTPAALVGCDPLRRTSYWLSTVSWLRSKNLSCNLGTTFAIPAISWPARAAIRTGDVGEDCSSVTLIGVPNSNATAIPEEGICRCTKAVQDNAVNRVDRIIERWHKCSSRYQRRRSPSACWTSPPPTHRSGKRISMNKVGIIHLLSGKPARCRSGKRRSERPGIFSVEPLKSCRTGRYSSRL